MESFKLQVIVLKEAQEFLDGIASDARKKIIYNIRKVKSGLIDKELFKKLGNTNIWEFRTVYNDISYRLLAFWDTEEKALIVATNGFVKKSQKTPNKEIKRAEKIRQEYLNSK